MANVHDVAAYVVQYFNNKESSRARAVGTMHMQKLLYFIFGYHHSVTREELFPERFEAWPSGPVCREVFDLFLDEYAVEAWPAGNAAVLTAHERTVADFVLNYYYHSNGMSMSRTSKEQAPWIQARAVSPDNGASDLDPETIGAFFRALSDAPDTALDYANRFIDKYRDPLVEEIGA